MQLGDTRPVLRPRGHLRRGQGRAYRARHELAGNAATRGIASRGADPSYNQINIYTNEGRSEYKALVASVNGTLAGRHLIAASFTLADKKNINDDFSPALVDYPSDPADIEAEFGRSRADERYRFVVSARLPAALELHAGADLRVRLRTALEPPPRLRLQRRRQVSDRAAGGRPVRRGRAELRPVQPARSPRASRSASRRGLDLIAEAFNLFNRVNDDVNSIDGADS